MSRKRIILILLFLSWPVCNAYRHWGSNTTLRHFYPLSPARVECVNWYIHDVCSIISNLFVLAALWLYASGNNRRDSDIQIAAGAVLSNYLIDVPNYLLTHRSSSYMLDLEGIVMISAAVIITMRRCRQITDRMKVK